MKRPNLSLIVCAVALSSCAANKAIIVEEAPVKPTEEMAAVEPTPAPLPNAGEDDGFRLPDMLAMPDEEQLKSTPGVSSGDGDGTVTAQPPKE